MIHINGVNPNLWNLPANMAGPEEGQEDAGVADLGLLPNAGEGNLNQHLADEEAVGLGDDDEVFFFNNNAPIAGNDNWDWVN